MSNHDSHSTATHHKEETNGKFAMWFVFLFIAFVIAFFNFAKVMSHDSGEGHGAHGAASHATEATHSPKAAH